MNTRIAPISMVPDSKLPGRRWRAGSQPATGRRWSGPAVRPGGCGIRAAAPGPPPAAASRVCPAGAPSPTRSSQAAAAGDRADSGAADEAHQPHPDGQRPLPGVFEHVADQRQGGGRQGCPGDPQQRAGSDQHLRADRIGGQHRGRAEPGRAEQQQPAAADAVPQGAHRDQEPGDHEPVDVGDPQLLVLPAPRAALRRGSASSTTNTSMDTSRAGSASTASPTHSRRPARRPAPGGVISFTGRSLLPGRPLCPARAAATVPHWR